MTQTLICSPEAQADLDEIFDFIATDNPTRAETYIVEIRQACRSLCVTPLIGMPRPDLRRGVRIFPLWRRIVIAHDLPPGRVDILRLLLGGQAYEAIVGSD